MPLGGARAAAMAVVLAGVSHAHGAAPVSTPAVELGGSGDPGAGHVTVEWKPAGDPTTPLVYELEESVSPGFDSPMVHYRGSHTSSVVSGLPDGTRYFRIHAKTKGADGWGPWSKTYAFETKHHSIALAGSLFAVGALAFALTAAFVVGASRRVGRESREEESAGG